MTADRLRPQAEAAVRLAATAGVERNVGVLEIADEVFFDLEIALVDRRHERQRVHVLEDGALLVVLDDAVPVTERQAVDGAPVPALRHFLDGEVEFVPAHEVDRGVVSETFVRLYRHLGADEAGLEARIGFLEGLEDLDVVRKRGRRGVQHGEIVFADAGENVAHAHAVRGRVDQLGIRHHGGHLGEPCRIPERADFAPRLVTRTGAAVEPLIGGSLQK